jgi:hypothetical protein
LTPYFIHDLNKAQQILNMVSHFVRDDVRLSKVTRRSVAARELVKERGVDIDFLVGRAIKRPDSSAGDPAGRTILSGKDYEFRWLVCGRPPGLVADVVTEKPAPHRFRIAEYDRQKFTGFIIDSTGWSGSNLPLSRLCSAEQTRDGIAVSPEKHGHQRNHQNTQTAAADRHACRHSATVFHIIALITSAPSHRVFVLLL